MLAGLSLITRSISKKQASGSVSSLAFAVPARPFVRPVRPMSSNNVEGLSDNCWKQSRQAVEYPPLSEDLHTDVCVVGAGIAGLTTAYRLAAAGTDRTYHSYFCAVFVAPCVSMHAVDCRSFDALVVLSRLGVYGA